MIETGLMRSVSLVMLFLAIGMSAAIAAEPVRLITPEEASLPAPIAGSGQKRNLTRGPGVDVVAPSVIGVSGGPFRLAVRFKPRNGVPIEPDSVRVTYQRQPDVDLTARIKPFVSAQGIEAPAVIAPAGRHVIEIEATDKQGRVGSGQMTLTVN